MGKAEKYVGVSLLDVIETKLPTLSTDSPQLFQLMIAKMESCDGSKLSSLGTQFKRKEILSLFIFHYFFNFTGAIGVSSCSSSGDFSRNVCVRGGYATIINYLFKYITQYGAEVRLSTPIQTIEVG
jgi:hypothetical protein